VGFLSVISVWIGLQHTNRSGWWIPVLAGAFALAPSLWLGVFLTARLLRKGKDEGSVNFPPGHSPYDAS